MRPLTVDAERALKPDRSKSFRECLNDADKDICPEMIVVPLQPFMMGSPVADKDAIPKITQSYHSCVVETTGRHNGLVAHTYGKLQRRPWNITK
jgi:hypothetical protein